MNNIYNGTPHAINIIEGAIFNPTLRKYVGGEIVLSIPSNGMLNAKIETVLATKYGEIPVFGKSFSGVDALPEGYDVYIVSALYAAAAAKAGADTTKMYTVADPVYNDDGTTILGCRGICQIN